MIHKQTEQQRKKEMLNILPHDYYGSHLDNSGKTTDVKLEAADFEKVGVTLAEVWSNTVIDNYNVCAQYIKPGTNADIPPPSIEWCCEHVQQSQYCLQIIRCCNVLCCGQRRCNYNDLFPTRFLPAPIPYLNTESGVHSSALQSTSGKYGSLFQRLALANVEPHHEFKVLPFDLFYPSVSAALHKRICNTCGKYFTSQTAVSAHTRSCHHGVNPVNEQDTADDDGNCVPVESANATSVCSADQENDVVIVRHYFEWLQSEFTID